MIVKSRLSSSYNEVTISVDYRILINECKKRSEFGNDLIISSFSEYMKKSFKISELPRNNIPKCFCYLTLISLIQYIQNRMYVIQKQLNLFPVPVYSSLSYLHLRSFIFSFSLRPSFWLVRSFSCNIETRMHCLYRKVLPE